MRMKQHILAALREELEGWQALLDALSEAQRSAPLLPSDWTVKDVLAHLMAWQQRSVARVEAALRGSQPAFPHWPGGFDPDTPGGADRANAWIYQTHHGRPWPAVLADWRAGYERFIELSDQVSEIAMLDGDRFPWMNGAPLALVLLASYDHHQEHLEKLEAWLREDYGPGTNPK
jgi:uncharacterized protein (TIGR03083 family)